MSIKNYYEKESEKDPPPLRTAAPPGEGPRHPDVLSRLKLKLNLEVNIFKEFEIVLKVSSLEYQHS